MTVRERLADVIQAQLDDATPPTAESLATALRAAGWHHVDACPCVLDHCPDFAEHHDYARLVEAVQMLHAQAHDGPTDTVTAERCHREPCVTVGGGLVATADVRGAFTPGSRVPA